MKYEKNYVLQWTYRENAEGRAYTNTKHFDTELERNKFALDVFSDAKEGKIILEFIQEINLQTWRKTT